MIDYKIKLKYYKVKSLKFKINLIKISYKLKISIRIKNKIEQ